MSSPKELGVSLGELALSQVKASKKNKKQRVVDSWEDEEFSSGEETDRPQASTDYPAAPPPTPISPTSLHSNTEDDESHGPFHSPFEDIWNTASTVNLSSRNGRIARPEKTDAVAKRLIAGALGVKAPLRTDEQKAYDKAMKEKEMKRRNGEKEAKMKADEEAAKARAAAWND